MANPELIVLCDENGQPAGTAEKLAAHNARTPLHLAFSCYVFNDKGELLVTKRADSKKVWPGVWSNTVCGHPAPAETLEAAIRRRLKDELGMSATDFKVVLPTYRYKAPPFKGIVENEFCPVVVAKATTEPKPDASEVSDYKWLTWEKYVTATQADNDNLWSWWCKDQLKQLKNNVTIKQYAQTNNT